MATITLDIPKTGANLQNPQLAHAHRDRADAEREDVGERGDGDGDAGVLHGQPDPLRHRGDRLLLLGEVVEALHDDEHVVDADAEHQEGHDAVDRRVVEPHRHRQPQRDGHPEAHRQDPHGGEVHPDCSQDHNIRGLLDMFMRFT